MPGHAGKPALLRGCLLKLEKGKIVIKVRGDRVEFHNAKGEFVECIHAGGGLEWQGPCDEVPPLATWPLGIPTLHAYGAHGHLPVCLAEV